MPTCDTCGHDNPEGAAFCAQCGAPQAPAAAPEPAAEAPGADGASSDTPEVAEAVEPPVEQAPATEPQPAFDPSQTVVLPVQTRPSEDPVPPTPLEEPPGFAAPAPAGPPPGAPAGSAPAGPPPGPPAGGYGPPPGAPTGPPPGGYGPPPGAPAGPPPGGYGPPPGAPAGPPPGAPAGASAGPPPGAPGFSPPGPPVAAQAPPPGPSDPHGFVPVVGRLSGGARKSAGVAATVAAALLHDGEVVELMVVGRVLGLDAVAVLSNQRLLVVNANQLKPLVVTFEVDPQLDVQGWEEGKFASLIFTRGEAAARIDNVGDTGLAREMAARVRARTGAGAGPPA